MPEDQSVRPHDPASGTSDSTEIRDAACVIVIDRRAPEPLFLLGRRRASQVFLPNKWVFPGGRVDDVDRAYANVLADSSCTSSTEQLAFAVAAIRELYEEAGLALGERTASGKAAPAAWGGFSVAGLMPSTTRLTPLARAITPPGQPRRFDTWFFLAERSDVADIAAEPDGELLDLGWFTLDVTRALDLPYITRLIVDDVASHLASPRAGTGDALIPFYFQDVDAYRRELIDPAKTVRKP